jgi:hypothetical protein
MYAMADKTNTLKLEEVNGYTDALGDWRLHLTAWADLTEHGTPGRQPVRQVSHRETALSTLTFPAPSVAALHLNSSWKAAERASNLNGRLHWDWIGLQFAQFGLGQKEQIQLQDGCIGDLFDYLEEMIVAVTSAFAAMEAFCNIMIVEKLSSTLDVTYRRKVVAMTGQQIEEKLSTGQKLSEVLPALLRCPSPAGGHAWDAFEHLKDLRDSFTHFKRRDMTNPSSESTALHKLIDAGPWEAPETAAAMIRHFCGDRPPRWFANPAWHEAAVRCRALVASTRERRLNTTTST